MLKKANVAREQRQMVVTQAPKLEKLHVQESLYLILGQDHKAAVSPHDRRPGSGRCFAVAGGRTRPSSTLLAQDLEQSNYEREQYRGYWNDTFDENVTPQMELDKLPASRKNSRSRSAVDQAGLLDRTLDEMVDVREMHEFHTPSGRCWHVTPVVPLWPIPRGSMSELPAVFVYPLQKPPEHWNYL